MTGATLDQEEQGQGWRRHSEDFGVHNQQRQHHLRLWAEAAGRKSLSAADLTGASKRREQQQQQRLSSPSTAPSSTGSSSSFRPWSSGGSTTSSVEDNSGTPLSSASVRFVGVSRKDGHCVYMLHVDSGAEQFVVQKRYSQFRDFRQQLFALLLAERHCAHGPCKQLAQLSQLKFPRRTLLGAWKSGADLVLARERLVLLQRFTDAMLRVFRRSPKRQLRCCVNSKCAAMEAVREFLQIADAADAGGAGAGAAGAGAAAASGARESELVRFSCSSSSSHDSKDLEHELAIPRTTTTTTSANDVSRRPTARGFPPPTRVSLRSESDHAFDQLYPITEDSELVHMNA
ncbi:hypothetical protein PybrP1_000705 [[Pythium] brassicae (nom. inval.)]|nr:hypothetical protein PybrP1_000705 [[Pythium] brassicae (nom. inval.)]